MDAVYECENLVLYGVGWVGFGGYLCGYGGILVRYFEGLVVCVCCTRGLFGCGCRLWM